MSVRRFKFVSPGIFLNEIDNSQLPAGLAGDGPVIIGRSRKGPAMRPYKLQSFEEFVRVFGAPVAGGENQDTFREGNLAGPTYAAYAARAWLAAETSPVTFFRLLGVQSPDYSAGSGEAGWKNTGTPTTSLATNGGAYGLWVLNNTGTVADGGESGGDTAVNGVTGSLAAVFYLEQGSAIVLSGNVRGENDSTTTGSCVMMHSDASAGKSKQFTAQILDSAGAVLYKTAFNFDRDDDYFIRKRFNTNPMLSNASTVDSANLSRGENLYWLGESFEGHVNRIVTGSEAGEQLAFIAPIESGNVSWDERQAGYVDGRTPWFFSQDMSSDTTNYDAKNMTKLFRFHGLNHGEWLQKNMKLSITNLRPSPTKDNPYGTFDVLLRSAYDSDRTPQIIERYSGVDLNPDSENYIARRVGDVYVKWDATNKVLREYGEHTNQSEFIRIEMNPDVDNALTDPELLPFGVFGPPRPLGWAMVSGSTDLLTFGAADETEGGSTPALSGTYMPVQAPDVTQRFPVNGGTEAGSYIEVSSETDDHPFTGSFYFPATRTRVSASEGGFTSNSWEKAYFGLSTDIGYDGPEASTAGAYSSRFDLGYSDYLRGLPFVAGATEDSRFDSLTGPPAGTEYSWIFSLDDVRRDPNDSSDSQEPYWVSGSREAGTSVTALSGAYTHIIDPSNNAHPAVNKFTSAFYGGYDGFDIREAEPFNNADLSGKSEVNHAPYYTLVRAIDSVSDPEYVEANILTVPGVTNVDITQQVIDVAEERADALAIIDIENVYTPSTENTNAYADRLGNVTDAISSLKNRRINSSYACAYYPWVQIQDPLSRQRVWVPPSVVALGTFASSEKKTAPWFAPAGFNRGGLADPTTAGMRVLRVTERVVAKDRDRLYAANINPIAKFPNEGIVVFGQKTLQVTPSALDRINVRRLLIYIKKEISKISTGILFDQNVKVTWSRFKAQAEGFLSTVKSSLGLTEYKVVLDETTTTPDLVDRNIVYAKIFLKPARSIEFIAIDFVITRTGASFED